MHSMSDSLSWRWVLQRLNCAVFKGSIGRALMHALSCVRRWPILGELLLAQSPQGMESYQGEGSLCYIEWTQTSPCYGSQWHFWCSTLDQCESTTASGVSRNPLCQSLLEWTHRSTFQPWHLCWISLLMDRGTSSCRHLPQCRILQVRQGRLHLVPLGFKRCGRVRGSFWVLWSLTRWSRRWRSQSDEVSLLAWRHF